MHHQGPLQHLSCMCFSLSAGILVQRENTERGDNGFSFKRWQVHGGSRNDLWFNRLKIMSILNGPYFIPTSHNSVYNINKNRIKQSSFSGQQRCWFLSVIYFLSFEAMILQ